MKKGRRLRIAEFRAAGNDKCPICWVPFSKSRPPTVEHVPPKSLGGVMACLTCRECNVRFSEDEKFLRRDVTGTVRAIGYKKGGKRVASWDLAEQAVRHGQTPDGYGSYLDISPKENEWPSSDALTPPSLYDIDSIKFEVPSAGQVRRAWIKSLYLMAGCARRGEAWDMTWAEQVRDYLRGSTPWSDDIAFFDDNFDTPSESLVARLQVGQSTDVFVSSWKKYLCMFGASVPSGRSSFPSVWSECGPFVYGRDSARP